MIPRLLGTFLTSLALAAAGIEASASEIGEVTVVTPALGVAQDGSTRFTITGEAPVLVVIRGLGPSLVDEEILLKRDAIRDPALILFANGAGIASNDDWQDGPNADLIPEALRPTHAVEAALALMLAPGEYVAAVQEKGRSGRGSRFSRLGAVAVTRADSGSAGSACANASPICDWVTHNGDQATCLLSEKACAVDLALLVQELAGQGIQVTTSTSMIMAAIGGAGGSSADDGAPGGEPGEAQTMGSIADLEAKLGTTQLYYFIGDNGADGASTCGGAGGAATIVTIEDLSANPNQTPDSAALVLVAGGGGGGGGQNEEGLCLGGGKSAGGVGGDALASSDSDQSAPGQAAGDCPTSQGGGAGGEPCAFTDGAVGAGAAGPGGLGGSGGTGSSCRASSNRTVFVNATPVVLGDAGAGGAGGSGEDACDSGGGGGGGGMDGGGGGGHGNDVDSSAGGGGGSSFARAIGSSSTTAAMAESTPGCSENGCVYVQFELTR